MLRSGQGWTQGKGNVCTEVMDQIVEVLRGDGIVCASHLVMRGDEMMVTMMITRIEA